MSFHPMSIPQYQQTKLSFFDNHPKSEDEIRYDKIVKTLPIPLSWFKLKPFLHQMQAFRFGLTHPRAAMLLPIGSGKTAIAINLLRYRIGQGQVKKALIVAPLSVLSTWEDELQKHSDLEFHVIRGSRAKKLGILCEPRESPEIIISNYESVRIYEKGFIKKNFQIIIADESTKIKSPRTKVSHVFWRVFKLTPYKIILTGLPMPNNILDSYSQFKFLSPCVFGTNYQYFKNRYGKFGGYQNYTFLGPRNLKEFRQKLFSISITFKREELFDLPPRTYEIRNVTLSADEKKAYESMKKDFLIHLETEQIVATNILTQFLRLHQVTSGIIGNEDGKITEIGSSKLKVFISYMEDEVLGTESKTLVFVEFIHTLKRVENWAIKKKLNPAVIYGAIKEANRGDEIRRFQNDPACRILIGQISTVSYGLNLTAANITIFLESNFSFGDRDQCEGRNYRIGQTQKVTVIDFVVPKSIDTYVLSILKKKRNFVEVVMRQDKLIRDGKDGLF